MQVYTSHFESYIWDTSNIAKLALKVFHHFLQILHQLRIGVCLLKSCLFKLFKITLHLFLTLELAYLQTENLRSQLKSFPKSYHYRFKLVNALIIIINSLKIYHIVNI